MPIPQATSPVSLTITESSQPLYTSTPDPNLFTSSAEIDQEYSQAEIAKTLYAKWLDHFLSKKISLEMRLNEYVLDSIVIPVNQGCAKKLGGIFIAEASVTIETTLPLVSTTSYERSDWGVGGGNIIDNKHATELFRGVVFKSGNTYSLRVITRVPMCD